MHLREQCDVAQYVQVQRIVNIHELRIGAAWSAQTQSVWHGFLVSYSNKELIKDTPLAAAAAGAATSPTPGMKDAAPRAFDVMSA